MPCPLLNPCSCECVEYNSNEVLGFGWLGKDAEALLEKSTDGKIRWSPKACFTCSHVTNSRQSESSQLSTIHVERKQVPKILNTTQVIWLDVSCSVESLSGNATTNFFTVFARFNIPAAQRNIWHDTCNIACNIIDMKMHK